MKEKEAVEGRVNGGKMDKIQRMVRILKSKDKIESSYGFSLHEIAELLCYDHTPIDEGKYEIPCKVTVGKEMKDGRIVSASIVMFSDTFTERCIYDYYVYLEDDPDRLVICVPEYSVFLRIEDC